MEQGVYNELVCRLNEMLLDEMPHYRSEALRFATDDVSRRRLLRRLMNMRYPNKPLPADFLRLQDALLQAESRCRGVTTGDEIVALVQNSRMALWRGDITTLAVDAIVNAANDQLLGCFVPEHRCIDNAIHSAAGLGLREACHRLMQQQGHSEPPVGAKITKGYNLPCRYVIHTVGPIVDGVLTAEHRQALAACYQGALTLAAAKGLETIAFCCISTGEFHFPKIDAAQIATSTVEQFLRMDRQLQKVIFNVFSAEDEAIYQKALAVL